MVDEKASGLENPTDVGAYASFAQNPVVGLGLVARGSGDPAMLIKSIQGAVQRVNKYQVLDRPMTVTRLKADSTIGRRLPTYLLAGFALLAMLLACAGIYGVLSFVTAKRTQELGIRAALGASQWDLVRMVIRGGTLPVIAGIVLGLGGAMWLSRFMQAMLFQVSPIDAPSLAAVARALPHRRAGGVLRARLARIAHRSDDGAQAGVAARDDAGGDPITGASVRTAAAAPPRLTIDNRLSIVVNQLSCYRRRPNAPPLKRNCSPRLSCSCFA